MNTIFFDEFGLVYCNGRYIQDPKSEYISIIEQKLVKRNYYIYRLQFDSDKVVAKATWKWNNMFLTKDFSEDVKVYNAIKTIFKEAFDQLEREG